MARGNSRDEVFRSGVVTPLAVELATLAGAVAEAVAHLVGGHFEVAQPRLASCLIDVPLSIRERE